MISNSLSANDVYSYLGSTVMDMLDRIRQSQIIFGSANRGSLYLKLDARPCGQSVVLFVGFPDSS